MEFTSHLFHNKISKIFFLQKAKTDINKKDIPTVITAKKDFGF